MNLDQFRELIETIRKEEIPRLNSVNYISGLSTFRSRWDCVYLDNGGAALYTDKQVDAYTALLKGTLYGNPRMFLCCESTDC
jgi:hypothetical protein